MAPTIPYTRPGALQVPHGAPSHVPGLDVRLAFALMLDSLAHLLRVEAAFVGHGHGGVRLDLDATTHGHTAVDAAARAVLDLAPAQLGDRALQIGALLVRMAIGMEDPVDRAAVRQMIGEARARLLLAAGDPEAGVVNRLLSLSFVRLDRLVALEAEAWADMDAGMDIGSAAEALSL